MKQSPQFSSHFDQEIASPNMKNIGIAMTALIKLLCRTERYVNSAKSGIYNDVILNHKIGVYYSQ